MVFQALLLVILLALSAFFSGSETALFALSRHELNRFRRDRRASRRLVAELMRHPRRLLLTLMIGNVTINTFIFAVSLTVCQAVAGEGSPWAPALGLISPVVVTLLGEILPKGTAIVTRGSMAPRLAPLVRVFQVLLKPVSFTLNTLLVEPITRLLVGPRHAEDYVTVDELRELVEMSRERRVIDADENAMLAEVIELGELRVRDIMVPRVDVIAFDLQGDTDALRRLLRERRFPKLPVYDGSIDQIVGLIYAKDLYLEPDRPPAELVRPVTFVPELITLTQLLTHFRRTRTQLAIAVDERGGVVGVVTMEDVAEQIVGELTLPEEGPDQPQWIRLDERRYRVAGGTSIHPWADQFQVRHLDERATTVAGLVLARLGRLPAVGDRVRLGNLRLTVESLRGRRIEWILLELCDDEAAPAHAAGGGHAGEGRS